MKNQYFGDVGDYGKYGLLRYLAKVGIKIAVNWYLTDKDGSNDGKHTTYLKKDKEYSHYDPELYALLKEMLLSEPEIRDVEEFEKKDVIPGAVYYHELLNMKDPPTVAEKRAHRDEWHKNALEACKDAELVFLDPDNGLAEKNPKSSRPLRNDEKYAYVEEAAEYYERGQDVVYYCHKGRRDELQWNEYKLRMKKKLPAAVLMGVTFHRGTQRSYIFICHLQRAERYRKLLAAFVDEWKDLFTDEPMELPESEEDYYRFHGVAKKIQLISNGLCYGPVPEPGDVIEQHLTIGSNGEIWLSHYGYAKGFKKERLRSEQFSISAELANYILAAVGLAFSRRPMPILVKDAGDWNLQITDEKGHMKELFDSLIPESDPEGLSNLIRKELGRKDLILFDGLAKF